MSHLQLWMAMHGIPHHGSQKNRHSWAAIFDSECPFLGWTTTHPLQRDQIRKWAVKRHWPAAAREAGSLATTTTIIMRRMNHIDRFSFYSNIFNNLYVNCEANSEPYSCPWIWLIIAQSLFFHSQILHGHKPHEQQHYLLPRMLPSDAHKKCLIVDLDETLVHSSFKVYIIVNPFPSRIN